MLRSTIDRPSAKVKMSVFYCIFISLIFICFLAGWLTGQGPYIAKSIFPTKCIVDNPTGNYEFDDRWHIPHGKPMNQRINCIEMKDLNTSNMHITMDEVVYVFEIPETGNENLSKFVLNINAYLMLDVVFREQNMSLVRKRSKITYEVKMGFQNRNDTTNNWTTMVETTESRNLQCKLNEMAQNHPKYGCNFIPFFTLGDDYNHRFLINIRFPNDFVGDSTFNHDIHSVDILKMVLLHQTAEFARLLSMLKFVTYPAAFVLVIWFFKCLDYEPVFVIEKSCLFLGFAHILLNLPIDIFLAHRFFHFMVLVNYLREIIFFAALTVFCASFFGQFIKGKLDYKVLCFYFLYLSPLNLYSLVFLTDLFEKIVQIGNPFFSMWDTLAGFRYIPTFNLYSAVAAGLYLLLVAFQFHVFYRNIFIKQKVTLHTRGAQLHSCGIRAFKFLLFGIYSITLLSTLEFMYFQLLEYNFKMEGISAEILCLSKNPIVTGFLFSICALWNLFTFAFIILYAPNKDIEDNEGVGQEELEMEVVRREE